MGEACPECESGEQNLGAPEHTDKTQNIAIIQRKIPENRGNGAVVMKLDVEGKELEVIPDLVMSGAMQYLDQITHIPYSYFITK